MPSSQQAAEALALVQAQAAAREQITSLTTDAVVAQVRAFAGWYDHAAITKLADRLAKLTRASQKRTSASTDAYATRLLKLLGQKAKAHGPVPPESLRSVPLESVYGRLADQYRYLQVSRGPNAPAEALERRSSGILIDPFPRLTEDQLVERVVVRARVQVEDNLNLAVTHQWAEDLDDDSLTQVLGYRRVLHPELSKGGSCGLCVAASSNLYSRESLMPLHARCACDVMPVIGDPYTDEVRSDPGAEINAADLKALYKRAGSTAAADLKKTRWKVVGHSELGPRLVAAEDHVRTAEEAEKAAA
jgi:hypothetical protein